MKFVDFDKTEFTSANCRVRSDLGEIYKCEMHPNSY